MAGKLPTVTEYIKNLGKSVAYATIEEVKAPTETVSDFMETNEDLFKVIYSATKNYKQTIKAADKAIKSSKIYDAANLGFKAIKEDLRTGKFYNKEREDSYGMSGLMGDDFADFSEFNNDDLDSLSWDDDDNDEVDDASKTVAKASMGLGSVIANTSQAQSNVIVSSAEAIANVNKASTKLLSAQNDRIYGSMITGFSGVNKGISLVVDILSGPMTNYMNESTKFYGDISNKLTETNAYLKEMTEMQRNLYKVQEAEYKQSKYDEVVSSSGAPDLTAYMKRVYKNIVDLDPTGGMLSGDKDENMFKMFVGSPLKAIPTMIARMIIPATVTKTLKAFDENMSGLFSSFIARMNTWADSDAISDINIKGLIGSILGIKIDKKNTIDTGKYKRGPMPFDGETKKAIVDVIPAYLARIESALTDAPERIFDGNSGTFKTVRQVHKEYKDQQESVYAESISSIKDSFDKWVNMMADTESKKKDYQKKFKELGKAVYNRGGDFDPYIGLGPKGDRNLEDNPYTKIFGDDWFSIMRHLELNDKKGIYNISKNTIDAMNRQVRNLKAAEGGFGNPFTALFDKRFMDTDKHGKLTFADPNNSNTTYKKNSKFMTATDYLKDILAEVRWIRKRGLPGGGPSNKTYNDQPYSLIGPQESFDIYYKNNFNDDTVEDEWTDPDKEDKILDKTKAEKEKSTAEKLGITKDNLVKEFTAAKTLSDKWGVMKKGVDQLLKKPAYWITSTIEKADQRVYELMFGNEKGETFRDKAGLEYRGFLDYLVSKTSDIFDKFKNKMKDSFKSLYNWFKGTDLGKKITDKGKEIRGKIGGALKSKMKFLGNRFSGAMGNTYGKLIARMRRGEVIDAEEVSRAIDTDEAGGYTTDYLGSDSAVRNPVEEDAGDAWDAIQKAQENSAFGRIAGKYGLTMLSPGEIVIPNPSQRTRIKNLRGEKKEKSRIMQALKRGSIAHNANGSVAVKGKDTDSDKAFAAVKKVMHEIGGNEADIAADALIGGGVSLITGLMGGPLLGAAVGAGVGLAKNSKTVNRFLFGETAEDGTQKGGIIPKKVQDFFTKNSEGMIDFGLAGAVAGLFTPLGLVGGALAGGTLGYVKNTKWFQDTMFGNEVEGKKGLMSKETQDKIKKAFPAIGIGAAAGALLGPFGLVGNLMLGSTAGYITTTNKFKEILLGKEGEDGKRKGGIAGAFKKGFVDPMSKFANKLVTDLKDYAKDQILKPTKDFFQAGGQFIRNSFISIGSRIADTIGGVFAKHVGVPLEDYLREKVFKRITGALKGIITAPLTIAKGIVSLPFKAMGGIANTITSGQIARGSLDTRTAQERLDFRDQHKARFARMKLTGRDKTLQSDQMLANMDEGKLARLRESVNIFNDQRGTYNKKFRGALKGAAEKISQYFEDNGIYAKYGARAINVQKDILRFLEKGDIEGIRKRCAMIGVNGDDLLKNINIDELNDFRAKRSGKKDATKEALAEIVKLTGNKNFGKDNKAGSLSLKRFSSYISTEIDDRAAKRIRDGTTIGDEKAAIANSPQAEFAAKMAEKADDMITVLRSIDSRMQVATGTKAGDVDEKTGELKEPLEKVMKKAVDVTTATGRRDWRNQHNDGNGKTDDNGNHTVYTDDGPVTYDEKGNLADDKATQDTQRKKTFKEKAQEKIASGMSAISGFFGNLLGKKKEKEEAPSLISRIMGGAKNVGSTLLGGAGKVLGGLSKVAGPISTIIGGAIGFSLLGHGSEFLRTKVTPWFQEHIAPIFGGLFERIGNSEVFQTIKGHVVSFTDSIKDGSFFRNLMLKFAQGFGFGIKNIAAPLVSGLITSLPGIIWGVVKGLGQGIWGLLKSALPWNWGKNNKDTVFANGDSDIKNATNDYNKIVGNLPASSDEAEIAKEFSGINKNYKANATSIKIGGGGSFSNGVSGGRNGYTMSASDVSYSSGNTSTGNALDVSNAISNGATLQDNGNGTTTMLNKKGEEVGTIDSNTGEMISGNVYRNDTWHPFKAAGMGLARAIGGGKTIGNLAGKVAKGITTNGIKGTLTNAVTKGGIYSKALRGVYGLGKGLTKVVSGGISAATNLGNAIRTKGLGVFKSGADKLTDVAFKATDNIVAAGADDAAGFLTKKVANLVGSEKGVGTTLKLGEKIAAFGLKLADSKFFTTIFKFLKKGSTSIIAEDALKKGVTKFFSKLGDKVMSGIAGKAAEKVAQIGIKAIAGVTPITLGFWIASFLSGAMFKTETLLGVAKDTLDISLGTRFIVGLINAVNENLLLGLIDTADIIKFATETFGDILGVDGDELAAAQEKTDQMLAEAGLEAGDTKNLEELNNQENIFKKAWNGLKGFNNWLNKSGQERMEAASAKAAENTGTGRYSSNFATGKGRGGRQGGPYANMKYGGSTIGEAGCAPVAAASLLGSNIPEAAKYAQMTGHVGSDGSTDIGYFNDYFSAKGVANRTTSNKRDVTNALKSGHQAVLLGRDPNGGINSPYSDSSHFITAKGMDRNGNVLVDDPELGPRKLSKGSVLKNMKASVITGKGKAKRDSNTKNTNPNAIDSAQKASRSMYGTENTANARMNADKIVQVAEDEVNTKEHGNNEVKYNDEYWGRSGTGAPWCCAFVWWVFKHAGASALFFGGGKTASCTELMNYYKAKGQVVSTPKKGDLIFFNFDKSPNKAIAKHIGICYDPGREGWINTIEGNTSSGNSGSQDNGGGVYKRSRRYDSVVAIVRPNYADATFEDVVDDNSSKGGGLLDAITSLGKAMVKSIFGENLYNAFFGADNTDSDGNYLPNVDSSGELIGSSDAEKVWKYLRSKGYSEQGTAGIMGNLVKESGLKSNNLEDSAESKVGMNDDQYTEAINSGRRNRSTFVKDPGGYGLAQWSFSRKGSLYDKTISQGKSINDTASQLDLLDQEVNQYGLEYAMKHANDVSGATDKFVKEFEKPVWIDNPSSVEWQRRREASQSYYNQFKGTGRAGTTQYLNNYPSGTSTVTAGSGTMNYNHFLQTIVTILMSIADNTDVLNKILSILSDNFNIDVKPAEVTKATGTGRSKNKAREALNELMGDRANAQDVANILQSKDTNWLLKTMTTIAQE